LIAPDLRHPGIVFCESLAALCAARAAGLANDAAIRSTAPALAFGDTGVEPLEVGSPRLMAYWNDALALSEAVFRTMEDAGHSHAEALVAARTALGLHRKLTNLLALTAQDFTEPRLFIGLRSGDSALDARLIPSWIGLLAQNPRFSEYSVESRIGQVSENKPPSIAARLRLSGIPDIGCRLALWYWRDRNAGTKPVLLLSHPTEITREIAWELCRKGMALKEIKVADPANVALADIDDAVLAPVGAFLDRWFPSEAKSAALALWRQDLSQAQGSYLAALAQWRVRLPQLLPQGKGAILTGFPGTASALAMGSAAQENGIPLVAVQHGVTREIAQTHDALQCNFENAACDLFLTFNPEANEISQRSPFGRSQITTIGMPRVYRRMRRSIGREKQYPILYVSTALLAGNVNYLSGGVSDIERTRREMSLVDAVLSRLPHGVTYKPYSSGSRYADSNPVLTELGRHPRIKLYTAADDLRYMADRYRILVTARATSTVSWCLMAQKPVVYINHPDHAPLRPDARTAFAQALFLFDWDAHLFERLRDFLSQPLADIEDAWDAMAKPREELCRRFLTIPGWQAGVRGAEVIWQKLNARTG
jgi:hypothetical protein